MRVLDVLAKDVGVMGVFADWPATVTYLRQLHGFAALTAQSRATGAVSWHPRGPAGTAA